MKIKEKLKEVLKYIEKGDFLPGNNGICDVIMDMRREDILIKKEQILIDNYLHKHKPTIRSKFYWSPRALYWWELKNWEIRKEFLRSLIRRTSRDLEL